MALNRQSRPAPPQRILMTTDTVGGVWSYSIDLAQHLCAGGATVLLASMGRRANGSQLKEAEAVDGLELVDSEFPLEWTPEVTHSALAEASRWLMELSRRFRPDIVHLNDYVHGSVGWDVPALIVAHSCVFSWWLSVHGCLPPPEWQDYARRLRRGISSASAVVAPSRWMAKSLQDLYGCDPNKLTVIPNFSDLKPTPKPKRPEIFAAGRFWDTAKNLQMLDQIAPGVKWPIRIAGDLAHDNQNRAIPEFVTVEGFLPRVEIAERLAACSIFAHPAKYEPFGLAVLEAARNRCALVLSDIPSLRELWDESALFAPPDDAKAWTDALQHLIDCPAACHEYGRRALERSRPFSVAEAGKQYTRLYLSVISGYGQSTPFSAWAS